MWTQICIAVIRQDRRKETILVGMLFDVHALFVVYAGISLEAGIRTAPYPQTDYTLYTRLNTYAYMCRNLVIVYIDRHCRGKWHLCLSPKHLEPKTQTHDKTNSNRPIV